MQFQYRSPNPCEPWTRSYQNSAVSPILLVFTLPAEIHHCWLYIIRDIHHPHLSTSYIPLCIIRDINHPALLLVTLSGNANPPAMPVDSITRDVRNPRIATYCIRI